MVYDVWQTHRPWRIWEPAYWKSVLKTNMANIMANLIGYPAKNSRLHWIVFKKSQKNMSLRIIILLHTFNHVQNPSLVFAVS